MVLNKDRSSCFHYFIYLLLTVCYIGVIFYLSSLPSTSLSFGGSSTERILSNLAHIPLYGVLAILLLLFLKNKVNQELHKRNRYVFVIAMCIAMLDELNQSTVSGRTSSLLDIVLDGTGVIIVLWLAGRRLAF